MTHLFLENRHKGLNLTMTGKLGFCYIMVSDPLHPWTKAMEKTLIQSARQAASFLMKEASKRQASLHIRSFVIPGTLSHEIGYDDNSSQWVLEILSRMKYQNIRHMWDDLKRRYQLDDVAIAFVFPYKGTSFARQGSYDMADEYAVLLGYDSYTTITHEICHLYGAVDYYYTQEVKDYVHRYFGSSIMLTTLHAYIDDLTAYLIGWTSQLSPSARAFLEDTSHITKESWIQALKATTITGQGTIHYENGRYEGTLKNGTPEGYGRFIYNQNTAIYQGYFRGGHFCGQGELRYANGDVYKGEFANDTFNGFGIYYHHNGARTKGTWKDGKCIKKKLF